MLKKIILFLILAHSFVSTFCQINNDCDVFALRGTEFDSLVQHEYISNKADTILAAKHSYSTNGIGKTFAVICWKENGKFQFKLFTRKNNEIRIKTELSYWLRQHITSFFDKEIYRIGTKPDRDFYTDDGPYSLIVFSSKYLCWSLGMGSTNHQDLRVIWMKGLISIIGL